MSRRRLQKPAVSLITVLSLFSLLTDYYTDCQKMQIDPVILSQKLIEFPSVSRQDKGSLNFLKKILQPMGFKCVILEFGIDADGTKTSNLYARIGTERPNLCFAGHVDVVPPGNLNKWTYPPYSAEIHDGVLYGRGAVDMKPAIAAFVTAVSRLVDIERINGSISFIITSNEEGADKRHGTQATLKWLQDHGEKLDFCIVGEPTNKLEFGDMIKIGRRGILSFQVQCYGKQGHVAYQELADNPINRMVTILNEIKNTVLDNGTEHFQPSNCEIVSIDVGNPTYNLIPDLITSRLNVRYNTLHTSESLIKLFKSICDRVTKKHIFTTSASAGDPFLVEINEHVILLKDIVKKFTGLDTKLGTEGGTSDARFIKNYCNLVEFGLVSRTAHHINECTPIEDIYKLTSIYEEFIIKFFKLSAI